MRVVVSGGGTGGHIFPAMAVCESLQQLDPTGERLYIGATSGMETEIVPATGIPFQAVTARKMPRRFSLATIKGLFALLKGYREARTYLQAFRAEAVVGSGGYVAAATVLAGVRLGLPTLILENNVVAGRTNLRLARSARKICVSFAETIRRMPAEKCVLTGLPLRRGIVAPAEITPQAARCRFPGLASDRFTLLVIGGSQGARAINHLIVEAAPVLLSAGVQILHQTGPKNIEEVCAQAETHTLLGPDRRPNRGYVPYPFFESEQIPLAYRAADLIVCRGGISTLSELMANGLPAIVVPLPTAYADHQTANARALEAGGAALHRAENGLSASNLTEDLLQLRNERSRLASMQQASRAMGKPEAADTVARLALELKA